MVQSFTEDFSVTWDDPADAQQTWLFDPMHLPNPMCQALAEFWDGCSASTWGLGPCT